MGYVSDIDTYTVDLTKSESERWLDVILNERKTAKKLFKRSKEDHALLIKVVSGLFKNIYKLSGGLYIDEMNSWADSINVPVSEVVLINCQYELSHMRLPGFLGDIFGCTAGAIYTKENGYVHVRNMDWPLKGLGDATRIFRFKKRKREFITIGAPGQIGVLSGMLPRSYSITLNYAPVNKMPWFNGYGPLFLLRTVFEECDTFEDAVRELKNNPLATNCFYLVTGTRIGEACVIERTKNKKSVRYIEGDCITLGNHFKSKKFRHINEEELEEDSLERESALIEAIKKLGANRSLIRIANCLDVSPVLNYNTCQQMLFMPKSGDYKIWRYVKE